MLRVSATTTRSAGASVATLLLLPLAAAAASEPRIAIIIDDLGYHAAAARRTVELPGPVACAILPGSPRAAQVAEAAHSAGKEVLLHLPLEPMEAASPEPGEIVLDTTRVEFSRAFASGIAAVPHVSGVNTHRGSLLTQHPGHMGWLMEEISAHPDLFFIDSYTTPRSIALRLAREGGVPAARRDVFLDPDRRPATVEREFERLKRLARARGMAVGIGHPYPETLALLERGLPELRKQGFVLVGLRDYIALSETGERPAHAGRYSRRVERFVTRAGRRELAQ